MLTLLASLFGVLSSAVPNLFTFFKDKQNNAHELALLKLQYDNAAAERDNTLQVAGTQADIAESTALYKTYATGIKWVDALNGTVRPVITYSLFLLYAAVKMLMYVALPEHPPVFMLLDVMWTEEDQMLFAAVIGFYFGSRAMTKGKK